MTTIPADDKSNARYIKLFFWTAIKVVVSAAIVQFCWNGVVAGNGMPPISLAQAFGISTLIGIFI